MVRPRKAEGEKQDRRLILRFTEAELDRLAGWAGGRDLRAAVKAVLLDLAADRPEAPPSRTTHQNQTDVSTQVPSATPPNVQAVPPSTPPTPRKEPAAARAALCLDCQRKGPARACPKGCWNKYVAAGK